MNLLMTRYCKQAGIPQEKASFDTLKHTCAMAILSDPRRSILDIRRKMFVAYITCHRYARIAAHAKACEASKDLPDEAAINILAEHYYAELVNKTKTLEREGWKLSNFSVEYLTDSSDQKELTVADTILPGHVYFVETADGQYVKIGYSKHPRRRFSQFGTLRPGPFALRLIGSFPGSPKTERWLHEKFQEDRDNGEWFRASDRLRAYIAAVLT
jgi:hypothetical protein